MKKVLLQMDTDAVPSVFDQVVGYDAGVDHIIGVPNVTPANAVDLVYGLMFTRGGKDLKNSAVFIGGQDVEAGEAVMEKVLHTFFGAVRVSVLHDSNGCNTTAAATVVKIRRVMNLKDQKAVVLAGTGPVGMRVALLLALEGARVFLTSRNAERAAAASRKLQDKWGVEVSGLVVDSVDTLPGVLDDTALVVATGKPGVMLLPREVWSGLGGLKVLADINAVPPHGIAAVESRDDGVNREGKVCFGALAIGQLKMRLQKACLADLFAHNEGVFDVKRVYEAAMALP